MLAGLLAFSNIAAADSAFSWGRWDGGEDMAISMTAGQPGFNDTSLNHWPDCLHGACGQHNEPGKRSIQQQSDTLVACQQESANTSCELGPKVTQK